VNLIVVELCTNALDVIILDEVADRRRCCRCSCFSVGSYDERLDVVEAAVSRKIVTSISNQLLEEHRRNIFLGSTCIKHLKKKYYM
jgi:hypothetical protein